MQLSTKHLPILSKLKKFAVVGVPPKIRTKLNSMFDSEELSFIYGELSRFATPCSEDVDTSDFAKFETNRFKHNNVVFIIDKVGKIILKNEMKLYGDTYTEGVYEAITCSTNYNKHLEIIRANNPDFFFSAPRISHFENPTIKSSNGKKTKTYTNPSFNVKDFIYRDTLSKKTEIFSIFCSLDKSQLTPKYELENLTNYESRNLFFVNHEFCINEFVWGNISRDLLDNSQLTIFKSTIKINGEDRIFIATSSQLAETELFSEFIETSFNHGNLDIYQANISELDSDHVSKHMDCFKFSSRQKPQKVTHLVHIRKVTQQLELFDIPHNSKNDYLKIKRFGLHPGKKCNVKSLKESNDRRVNERYLFESEVTVKSGLFKNHKAMLLDYSEHGAKIRFLTDPLECLTSIRIKIIDFTYPLLNLSGLKYDVLEFNNKTLEARLVLSKSENNYHAHNIHSLNINKITPFSLYRTTQKHIAFFSELSLFNMPGIHVCCNEGTSLSSSLHKGICDSTIKAEKSLLMDRTIKLGSLFIKNKNPLSENISESIKEKKHFKEFIWDLTSKEPLTKGHIKKSLHKSNNDFSFEIFYKPTDYINNELVLSSLELKGFPTSSYDFGNRTPKHKGIISVYCCLMFKSLLLANHFTIKTPTINNCLIKPLKKEG